MFSLIQPIRHSADRISRDIYKVEPYVVAADAYANESHKGRGVRTWYTGSVACMYQFITGSLLGLDAVAIDYISGVAFQRAGLR
ncbi:GH36-type glycosyl hydrolase domain-containing protein [Taibaiella koreensis]|uniref:GH36-type glycosyl hydrolase domain-containing protein n=1 Tax=Taibaiella koreensis TaxID=1268548 RepID=UPI000E59A1A9